MKTSIFTIAILSILALAFSCTNKSTAVADQKIQIINEYAAKLDSITSLEDYNTANEQFQLSIISINQTSADGVTLEANDSIRVANATVVLEEKMNSTINKIQSAMQDAMTNAILGSDSTTNIL